jgi:acetylornithine/succinyldiaminopimelate/putrescine aminotransferase
MGWKFLHAVERELFSQMLVTALFQKHRILTQIAGHETDVIKILPPLIIGEKEIERFVQALDAVLMDCRSFPGPIWNLGQNMIRHSVKRPAREAATAES